MMLEIPNAHPFRVERSGYAQVVLTKTGMQLQFLASDPDGEGSRTVATVCVPMNEVEILFNAILNRVWERHETVEMLATIVEGTA